MPDADFCLQKRCGCQKSKFANEQQTTHRFDHTFLFWNWGTNGHEWVCDGYQQIYETWCPSDDTPGGGEGFLYLHMNWGWDGTGNDLWQDFNQWIVFDGQTTDNWQYNQEMTYNIHP